MVDREKLRQKIVFMENNLSRLEVLKNFSEEEFVNDFIKVEAAKHLLQVMIESMIDIAEHVVSRKRLGVPSTSADAFKILGENGLLTKERVLVYTQMVKFRNRVVHLYYDVDEQEIFRLMQHNLEDFKNFIREIMLII